MPKEGVTQAALCRSVGEQYNPPRKVGAAQLSTFRKRKEVDQGNTCVVYYGAYVYFEKLRLKQSKPKTSIGRKWKGFGHIRAGTTPRGLGLRPMGKSC